jgi:hypothetical protein
MCKIRFFFFLLVGEKQVSPSSLRWDTVTESAQSLSILFGVIFSLGWRVGAAVYVRCVEIVAFAEQFSIS